MFSVGFQTHRHKKVSLLSSHLYMVSSFRACSLDVNYIAWLVAMSSEVDGFQPSAKGLKPIKITIDQIVVTNLNTSVNLDFNSCTPFMIHKETSGRSPIYMLPSPFHKCLTTMNLSLCIFITLIPYTCL